MSTYDRYAIPRRVRLQDAEQVQATGLAHFASKSMTKADSATVYNPVVDVENGAVTCDCNDFIYRLARHNPTIYSPESHLCKHLIRAIATLQRRGLLPQRSAPPCVSCETGEGRYEVCDNSGRVEPGRFICADCIGGRMAIEEEADAPAIETPPHVDPATGEIRADWVQIVTGTPDFAPGQWVLKSDVDAARAKRVAAARALGIEVG